MQVFWHGLSAWVSPLFATIATFVSTTNVVMRSAPIFFLLTFYHTHSSQPLSRVDLPRSRTSSPVCTKLRHRIRRTNAAPGTLGAGRRRGESPVDPRLTAGGELAQPRNQHPQGPIGTARPQHQRPVASVLGQAGPTTLPEEPEPTTMWPYCIGCMQRRQGGTVGGYPLRRRQRAESEDRMHHSLQRALAAQARGRIQPLLSNLIVDTPVLERLHDLSLSGQQRSISPTRTFEQIHCVEWQISLPRRTSHSAVADPRDMPLSHSGRIA